MRRNRNFIGRFDNGQHSRKSKSQAPIYSPVRQKIQHKQAASMPREGQGPKGRRPLLSQQQQAHRLIKQARSNKSREMLPVIVNAMRVVKDSLYEEAHVKLMVDNHGCDDVCNTMHIYIEDGTIQHLGLEILARLTYRDSLTDSPSSISAQYVRGTQQQKSPAFNTRSNSRSATNVLRCMKVIQAGGLPLSLTVTQRYPESENAQRYAIALWRNCVECFKHMRPVFCALVPAVCHAIEMLSVDKVVQMQGHEILNSLKLPDIAAAKAAEELEPEHGTWKLFLRAYGAIRHCIADIGAAVLQDLLIFLQEPQGILGKHDPLMHHTYSVEVCLPFLAKSMMVNFSKSESVNSQCLKVLYEVAQHNQKVQLYLVKNDFISLTGKVLDIHGHLSSIQADGLQLIGLLLRDQPETCDKILASRSTILSHMTKPLINMDQLVQQRSLVVQVLASLSEIVSSSTDGGAQLVQDWNLVLNPCRDALQKFVDDEEIQELSIRVLMALSINQEKRIRQGIADAYTIPALCTFYDRPSLKMKYRDFCMKSIKGLGLAHFNQATTSASAAPYISAWRHCSRLRLATERDDLSKALQAAREFGGEDESHRNALEVSGAIPLICSSVRTFIDSAWVVYHGLWCLAYISYGRTERSINVMRCGGVCLASDCMKFHPGHAGVQQNALWVLANAAQNEIACVEIVDSKRLGALPLIQNTLQKHVANARVQEQGMLLISNILCMNSESIKSTLILTTLPEIMLEAVSHHERDDRTMLAILLAIGNMGSHRAQQWQSDAADLKKLPACVVRSVKNYPHNPELHRYAFRALEKFLSKNSELLESVPMHEAVTSIVESVYYHRSDKLLQGYAAKLLRALNFESAFTARKWVNNQKSLDRAESMKRRQQREKQQQQQAAAQSIADITLTKKQKLQLAAAQQLEEQNVEATRHKPHPSLAPMPMTYKDALNLEMAMSGITRRPMPLTYQSPKEKVKLVSLPSPKKVPSPSIEEPLIFHASASLSNFTKHTPLPPPLDTPANKLAPISSSSATPIGSRESGRSNSSSRESTSATPKKARKNIDPLHSNSNRINQKLNKHQSESLQWMNSVVPLSKNWTAHQVSLLRPLVGQLSDKEKAKDPFGSGKFEKYFD